MKICLKSQNAGWILDQICADYRKYTRHEIVSMSDDPDVVWFVNLFCSPRFIGKVKGKSVIQVHHMDETKMNEYNLNAFNKADFCISPNDITVSQVKKYLDLPVQMLPYWLISSRRDEVKTNLRQTLSIPENATVIGSFVKDGEGKNGDKPKLSKGPDIFVDIIEQIHKDNDIFVLLGGYARDYVCSRLDSLGVNYAYLKRHPNANELYEISDWYFVTSRYEGGPQSVLEAPYRKVNILSSDVGMAKAVLHPDCICGDVGEFVTKFTERLDRLEYNYESVMDYYPEKVIPQYDDAFEEMINEG
jgi:glycosyltransferase involved in cell wall biosynthesis